VKYSGVVPSTGRPRCESPSEIGTVQATARCAAMARTLSMRMLLVAPPTRNTAYSISCTGPVRAPTTRSVPLTACESWRGCRCAAAPGSAAGRGQRDGQHHQRQRAAAVPGAARRQCAAAPSCGGDLVQQRQRQHGVEARGQALVVADEDQRAAGRVHASISRAMKSSRSAASSAEVGSSAITSSGRADQRARRRHALLLADRLSASARRGHRLAGRPTGRSRSAPAATGPPARLARAPKSGRAAARCPARSGRAAG
jgi:hypothetical protein